MKNLPLSSFISMTVIGLILSATSCQPEKQDTSVSVTGVELVQEELTIYSNETKTLKVQVFPENATDKRVFWSSSDYETASIDQNGVVKGNKPGTATITVITGDNEFKDECTVTVLDKTQTVPVTGITLNKATLTIALEETETLEVRISPFNATDKTVSWESSNENVASVYDDGTVIGLGLGETTITVTTTDGYFSANCIVTVVQKENLPEYIDEYGINQGQGIRIGDNIWAPVNCGFKAPTDTDKGYRYGKLYQWGRKDGLGYDENDATVAKRSSEKITDLNALDSETFYTSWNEKIAPDGTWGGADGKTKTEYDPCPDGWRVPTINELDQLKGDALDLVTGSTWKRGDLSDTPLKLFGRWFGRDHRTASASDPQGCVFLPSSGCLVSGYPRNREYAGIYWGSQNSSIYVPHADRLYFFENLYIYTDSKPRDYAYAIRCVKE